MNTIKSIATKGLLWIAIALTIPVQSYADEDDSIRTIKPLFDPVVVKDTVPDISNCPDIGKSVDSDTKSVRSGNTCKVGTPSTEATVSPMGAAVWSITFDTPPGVGGMMPSVGLAYSSQSGVGNAGWGMSISGVSSITRGTKTLYHDGVVRGVKYDTGDALFQGSIGRTDLPGGNYQQLIENLRNKIMTLPDNYMVLPGHGESSTIGDERKYNPFL